MFVKFTAPNGLLVWIRPDSVERVMGPVDVSASTEMRLTSGALQYVKESPQEVVKDLELAMGVWVDK